MPRLLVASAVVMLAALACTAVDTPLGSTPPTASPATTAATAELGGATTLVEVGSLVVAEVAGPRGTYPDGVRDPIDLSGTTLTLPAGDPLGLADVIRRLQAAGWTVQGHQGSSHYSCRGNPASLFVLEGDDARSVDIIVYPDAAALVSQWEADSAGDALPRDGSSCVSAFQRPGSTEFAILRGVIVENVVALILPVFGQELFDSDFGDQILEVISAG